MDTAKPRKPRGTYFEKTEERVREAMGHAIGEPVTPGRPGQPTEAAVTIAATAVAPLLGMSTGEARRFVQRARFLIDAGELGPDLLRRLNPTVANRGEL